MDLESIFDVLSSINLMDLAGIAPATPRCERGILLLYYKPSKHIKYFKVYYYILIVGAMASEKKPLIPAHKRAELEALLGRILKDVKPTEAEMGLATRYANEVMLRLKKVVPGNVEILSVGSVARGTQLRGSSDIDIFLLFPKGTAEDKMEKKGLALAKKIVKKGKRESYQIKYAEHPYLMLTFEDVGLKADIVPAFKIKDASERITAVDRTQLHNVFVNDNLSRGQKDDVILLKAFLKAHGIYGAGAKIEGFSGYLCELLIHHYGSFIDALIGMSMLKPPVTILPSSRKEYRYPSKESIEFMKKFDKKLVVIDPTDSNRNVAAVVSDESLARFAITSRILLKNPSSGVFYGPSYSDVYSERKLSRIRKELDLNIYVLHFRTPDIAEDIIWQQIRRLGSSLSGILRKSGFHPVLVLENVGNGEAILSFFISRSYASYLVVEGPSVFMEESAERFMQAHSKSLGMLFNSDRITFLEEPRFNGPREVIQASLLDKHLLPSYIKKEHMKLHINTMPESAAKLLYDAFMRKTSL